MKRDTLTGSRIRERRIMLGLKQADLARRANVSASYLNLIEHNRRRIGGKLLVDLAALLEVEPSTLREGAEATLIASLREVAASNANHSAEVDRSEEFAGRFPGWARLIDGLAQRQNSLEQTVVSLTDRMTHDPQLAEALHDMLGAVTAIRSTSSILVETDGLEPEWRDRFYRNINEDATRLTEGSQALVSYLNSDTQSEQQITTPQDEIESFFKHNGFSFEQLETVTQQEQAVEVINELLDQSVKLVVSASARSQLERLLMRYWQDSRVLSNDQLLDDISKFGIEPALIAAERGLDLGLVMRRMANISGELIGALLSDTDYNITKEGLGLVVCDSSGTLTMRKPLQGFALPRFGAACPLWTLYQALSRPLIALRERVEISGRDVLHFETLAFAAPVTRPQFGAVPLLESHMLIIPMQQSDVQGTTPPRPIGSSCRICPRLNCAGRREPSILTSGL